MCGDCWNATMGAPAAVVAARFAWVGYRDKVPFLRRSGDVPPTGDAPPATPRDDAAEPSVPAHEPAGGHEPAEARRDPVPVP